MKLLVSGRDGYLLHRIPVDRRGSSKRLTWNSWKKEQLEVIDVCRVVTLKEQIL